MKFLTALLQMNSSLEKEESLAKAKKNIEEASRKGADFVMLPEMWNCPYANKYFRDYSEPEGGAAYTFLSEMAKETSTYIIGGTIPEEDSGNIYNTCFVFDRDGLCIGKHRKAHLFDVQLPGKIAFMESKTLTPGDKTTVVDTEFCKVGIAICYDVRFPDMFRKMALEGAKFIALPAAFSDSTGKAHWDTVMKARAIDNQVYFAAVSPGKNPAGLFVAHGHSCLVDPWGRLLCEAGEGEEILYGEVDLDYEEEIRGQLPLLKHRREELY